MPADLLALSEAKAILFSKARLLETESRSLAESCHRCLANDIVAPVPLPLWDNSAMDGYAVHSADLISACPSNPRSLQILGKVPAGSWWQEEVPRGKCVRIYTGSPLPRGLDAVIMQEDTELVADGSEVRCLDSVAPFENVRLQGEDVRQGSQIAEAGIPITPMLQALLASLGIAHVAVRRAPQVQLITTGSELVPPGLPLSPGQIYQSNSFPIAAFLQQMGLPASQRTSVVDTLELTTQALNEGLRQHDVLITFGGVSVGDYDFVKQAWQKLGGSLEAWRISLKPGKPFVFGTVRVEGSQRYLLGLPGNPVSALVTFFLLARPFLLALQGAKEPNLPCVPARMAETVVNRGDRPHYMRVQIDSQGEVRLSGAQGSHHLLSLARCNGLIEVPAAATLMEGSPVFVMKI